MHVTYNWLKEFVEIKVSPAVLAQKLTMAGLEVTSLEEKSGDFVLELEITSNRADCLSVIGIAREVAAITNKKLRLTPSVHGPRSTVHRKNHKPYGLSTMDYRILSIKIEDKKDSPLYTAKIIRDVKVGPSPPWLKERLELIGCRAVNNVVDITNYILFTWGEPLHAFDLDKLNGRLLIVRRAKLGEKIITIDGQQRNLNSQILVIADEKRPVALAGIMGGEDTEVAETTRNILLEAAIFNPILIRHARQNLGIQSDSSYRFERGIDAQSVEKASGEAAELIQELAGGRCVLAKGTGLPPTQRKTIDLEVSGVQKILGVDIKLQQIKEILNHLGFKTKTKAKNCLRVAIPSHRLDVNLGIDLIEEIARIYGFEFIPETLPAVRPQLRTGQSRNLVSLVKNILVGLGLNEVITYSLMDKDLLNMGAIEILNPLSKEQEILRPTLIPSLAHCLAYNLNQKQEYVNIFEIAQVFLASAAGPKEELRLGIVLCGIKSLLLEQGLMKDRLGLLHLKGIFEVLFKGLGVRDYSFNTREDASIAIHIGKEKIGFFGRLAHYLLERLDIKNKEVFVAELSLERLFSCVDLNKKFNRLAVYPGISRDISLILKEDIAIGDILAAIKEKGQSFLQEVKVIDYYKGKQIPSGFKGLTLSCLYRLRERTLTEAEINPVHSLVCAFLEERFGAQIR